MLLRQISTATMVAALIASPAFASAAGNPPLTFWLVVSNTTMSVQLILLALAASMVAAVGVCVVKLMSRAGLSGGSAYLSGLRFGGPLAGLLGASVTGFIMFVGVANLPQPVTAAQLAPGIAEAMLMIMLGLCAGVVAVVCKWIVDARIDRAVLENP
jgi:hypothetical protein